MMTRRYSPPTISAPQPIDMVLHCPKCGVQHIDAPDRTQAKRGDRGWEEWDNPPHRSHLCHGCGHIWRPADVPTNGVAAVKTAGKADSPLSAPPPAQGVQDDSLLRHKLMVLIIRAESRREGTVDVEHVRAALAAPQPAAPAQVEVFSEHDKGILRDLEAMAADKSSGFWPQILAVGSLRIIKRLAAPQWQPIETAPKEAQLLLTAELDCRGDWRIKTGYYDTGVEAWFVWGASWKPTHWMPLPAAPGITAPTAKD